MTKFLLFLLTSTLAAQTNYDLLLQGGRVIDPKNSIDGRMDVAIANGGSIFWSCNSAIECYMSGVSQEALLLRQPTSARVKLTNRGTSISTRVRPSGRARPGEQKGITND